MLSTSVSLYKHALLETILLYGEEPGLWGQPLLRFNLSPSFEQLKKKKRQPVYYLGPALLGFLEGNSVLQTGAQIK